MSCYSWKNIEPSLSFNKCAAEKVDFSIFGTIDWIVYEWQMCLQKNFNLAFFFLLFRLTFRNAELRKNHMLMQG